MPQIAPSKFYKNEFGCWDFRGYTGWNFDTNLGAQPQVIKAITDRLMSTQETESDLEGQQTSPKFFGMDILDMSLIVVGILAILCIVISLIRTSSKKRSSLKIQRAYQDIDDTQNIE